MKTTHARTRPRTEEVIVTIEDLTHTGQGVGHIEGKTIFVDAALPGEEVRARIMRKKRQYDEALCLEILQPSPDRVEAKCKHFGICGGCALQHLKAEKQVTYKEKILFDNLERIGKVTSFAPRPAITATAWGYRTKARLGVKYVHKKGKVLVGFREKSKRYLADLEQCETLHPSVGKRLTALSELVRSLSCYQSIPQIEVAVGDNATALVFRHLDDLTDTDTQLLIDFAKQNNLHIYTQSKGPKTIKPLHPVDSVLEYTIDAYKVRFQFEPNDFVQVNREINERMVQEAIQELALSGDDVVLELFSGLGNFSLPFSRYAGQVIAVEGEASLIERAKYNAQLNDISNVEFHTANLFEVTEKLPWLQRNDINKVFLDPPRSGAAEILPQIIHLQPEKIIYISCNPSTLARDTDYLVNQAGYKLNSAGIFDMFPHTAHVESIATFTQQ